MIPDPTPTVSLRQADIPALLAAYRITAYPVAVRTLRETLGGGFADQEKHPYTWTVYFLVDGQWAQVQSARGLRREWSSLDRLEKWLRSLGFHSLWVKNEIEPTDDADDGPQDGPSLK